MGTIVDLTLPPAALPFGPALSAIRGFELELEPIVPVSASVCPFVWLLDWSPETRRVPRIDAFERRVKSHTGIEGFERIDTVEGNVLYRVTWNGDEPGFVSGVAQTDGVILEASGTATEWVVRLRFDDADRIADFQQYCRDNSISLELTRVVGVEDSRSPVPAGLTTAQTNTLVMASRMGYFDRPRQTSLEEIAERLEVSPQAAGGRIRRGISNLVSNTLPVDEFEEHTNVDDSVM